MVKRKQFLKEKIMFHYEEYHNSFEFSQLNEFISKAMDDDVEIIQVNDKLSYFNVPAAFDIETSSLVEGGSKFATMYIWQFGLNGCVIYGRYWHQFSRLMRELSEALTLNHNLRLIVYVHNLAYEFQFIKNRIEWATDGKGNSAVFSLKKRRPIYALASCGIEFRCSYMLSNCSLAYIGQEMLFKYPVQKLQGDLDYQLIRHSETPLTPIELEYCFNDVRVVMSYIQEKIENEGDIHEIPLTNTGYVRKFTRDYCMGRFIKDEDEARTQALNYRSIMRTMKIQSEKEYEQLKQAFAGGFTHANPKYSRYWKDENGKRISYLTNVESMDIASSYPYNIVANYMPMSSSRFIGDIEYPEEFKALLENYCCLFTITLRNVYQIFEAESYISVSKCIDIDPDYIAQNGRVVEAAWLTINVTELDFDIISNVYGWDEDDVTVTNMRIYDRGYLPKAFIESVLELYAAKTTLKGNPDKAIEYMIKKGMLNSTYGMCVTDIVRDDAVFVDGEWDSIEADWFSQLNHYNKSFTRFLFYPWGVWITAHARHNLWDAILEFGDDYVYADTDSIKGINFSNHKRFFLHYNLNVEKKLFLMCDWYGIDKDKVAPITRKGEKKLIGVWEPDATYSKFRTIGAKRYLYEYENGELGMTVSGVNKSYAIPYLLKEYCDVDYDLAKLAYSNDVRLYDESKEAKKELIKEYKDGKFDYDALFTAFDVSLEIPPGYSGKSIHTYVDIAYGCTVTDYLGNQLYCNELSYTHLEPTGYYFSMAKEYLDFLEGNIQRDVEI